MFMGLLAAAISRKYGPGAAASDPDLSRWIRASQTPAPAPAHQGAPALA
jgi:hypothetical protein